MQHRVCGGEDRGVPGPLWPASVQPQRGGLPDPGDGAGQAEGARGHPPGGGGGAPLGGGDDAAVRVQEAGEGGETPVRTGKVVQLIVLEVLVLVCGPAGGGPEDVDAGGPALLVPATQNPQQETQCARKRALESPSGVGSAHALINASLLWVRWSGVAGRRTTRWSRAPSAVPPTGR